MGVIIHFDLTYSPILLKNRKKKLNYFPIQKVTSIDNQAVMRFGQQIGNKICKIGGK